MPNADHADSVMNDEHRSRLDISDWSSSNPVTRVIKVTFIPYTRAPRTILPESPGGSGAKSLRMQSNASQRSMLRHEAAVASFNMSDDQLGLKGRLTKGSRPPHVKQSQGRKHR